MSCIHFFKRFSIIISCFSYCPYCLFVYPTLTLKTRKMRISIGTLLACLQVIKAVEIIICDCSNSKKNGFLKVNRHWELEKPIDPEYVKYEITTVRSEKLHFTGHFCSAKTVFQKTTVHIDKTRKFHQRGSWQSARSLRSNFSAVRYSCGSQWTRCRPNYETATCIFNFNWCPRTR